MTIDAVSRTRCRAGEEMCGARAEILRMGGALCAVLADGFGVGARAAAVSSLAIGMLRAAPRTGDTVRDVAVSLAESDPGSGRPLTAFTLMRVWEDGLTCVSRFGTPRTIILRRGRRFDPEREVKETAAGMVESFRLTLHPGDVVTAINGGLLTAGAAGPLGVNWEENDVAQYLKNAGGARAGAQKLADLLLAAGASLDGGRPAQDLAAAVVTVSRG